MNINISAWAIKRPIPIILLFLIIALMGFINFRGLGIDDNPNVDFPTIIVSIAEAGAAPPELETQVTRKVEDAVTGLANLDHITSTVSDGLSTTVVQFVVGSSSDRALNDVRDAVARVRQNLPADITEPQITHPNFSGVPFITYTVSSDRRSVADLSQLVDLDITRALLAVPNVAQVVRQGGVDREIRVALDPSRLQALGTSVDYVNTQIRQANINVPGGRATIGGQEQTIRTLGAAQTVSDLRQLPIALANGSYLPLGTLGTVADTHADPVQMAFLDNKPVVAFSVGRAQGAPIVQTDEAVRKGVAELQKTLPPDVHIEFVHSRADYTLKAYHASLDALFIGATLAVIVIFLFLRNWQATLISALAIPLSILGTFSVMSWIGYTLNGLTLLALTLVVGILVDDAIVDLENIHRHIAMGKTPLQAAFDATAEIGLAVVATTATIVAVFVPVAFMSGIPGMFFRSFGITVAVAVSFSLLVARTLTPMMAAYMLPAHLAHEDHEPFYRAWYMRVLDTSLRHRWITAALALVVFVASMALLPLLHTDFFPSGDIGETTVTIALPTGATIDDTAHVAQEVTSVLLKRQEVTKIFTSIGSASQGGFVPAAGSVTTANLSVILLPKDKRKLSLSQFEATLNPALQQIPGARIAFSDPGAGGGAAPLNIILRSENGPDLNRVANAALSQMRSIPGLINVTSSAAEQRPELQIRPDAQRAAEAGVSVTAIGNMARLATQGDVEFNLSKFETPEQEIPIVVQMPESVRFNYQAISNLQVMGRNGLVPLRNVADVTFGSGPVELNRYDRARQVTLSANLSGISLGDGVKAVNALPALKKLPADVTEDNFGTAKIMADIFSGFAFALGTGVLFIYAVLVLLFSGFLQPLTIMLALPLSIGGAFAGLLLGNKPLGMMALIGIVMLMGLATKNSILLVEYAMRHLHQGSERRAALEAAGHDRVRPILMTTIAMTAGMLPIAMSLGEGTESLSPMAMAVIGGLITSTLLTLVVVPSAYTFVDDFQNLLFRLVGRKKKQSPSPGAPSEPPQA